MEISKFLSLFLFCSLQLLAVLVHAQDQSDFISIDCGSPKSSSYNDERTDIKYSSDEKFINSGISKSISSEHLTDSLEKQFHTVRSFPEGSKNCYTLKPTQGRGNKYLIRARFMYGNYDGLGRVPEFDLYLGANIWIPVKLDNVTAVVTNEVIHMPRADHISVCLLDRGIGTPFISVLELRLLRNDTYESPYEALMLHRRWELGSTNNQSIRYKDDVYDRIWLPLNFPNHKILSTPGTVDSNNNNGFQPARLVMRTAITPLNESDPTITAFEPQDPTSMYYIYMHFTEIEELKANETREFEIFLNGLRQGVPFTPRYLYTDTLYNDKPVSGARLEYWLSRTEKSTLPPIISALEIYVVNEFLQSQTDQQDADAIMSIKSNYGVKKSWQGDPCTPISYSWDGVNCSYDGSNPPRVISVNLSLSGLSGQIDPSFTNISMIQHLDLSNNSLSGAVPVFLSDLEHLTVLNLEGNKLTGIIPAELLERSIRGSLSLRVGGNPGLCLSSSCQNEKKKNSFVVPIVSSVAGFFALSAVLALLWFLKKKRKGATVQISGKTETGRGQIHSRNWIYKYSDVMKMTNNLEKVLGNGAFGAVYYGCLDGIEVAVKMLSPSSNQGYKEFHAEVELLMRVHHRNLTSLIGYCKEGPHMGLIYEYMANGSLGNYLAGENAPNLSWEERLRICLDAAQGLEYHHHGCKPPIVHRDVKPANILLDEKMQAKLADFGLSRSFPTEGDTQVLTLVAGTVGYLDPEYYITQRLNEKSDVYSFGVILLEVITSQPVISRSASENTHIRDRVNSDVAKGDINTVVGCVLRGQYDTSSVWRFVDLSLSCTSQTSSSRPAMNLVVAELKDCLVKEMKRKNMRSDALNTEPAISNLDGYAMPKPR